MPSFPKLVVDLICAVRAQEVTQRFESEQRMKAQLAASEGRASTCQSQAAQAQVGHSNSLCNF